MAFLMRRPFAVTSTLARELQQSAPRTVLRSFQTSTQQPIKQNAFKQIAPITKQQSVFRNAFKQSRRGYQTEAPQNPLAQGNLTQRLIYGGAIFGGTLLAVNLVFNRETREDGGMPPYERSYLNETFLHTGLGKEMEEQEMVWTTH